LVVFGLIGVFWFFLGFCLICSQKICFKEKSLYYFHIKLKKTKHFWWIFRLVFWVGFFNANPVTRSNWTELLLLSARYSAADLKQRVLGFVGEHWRSLVQQEGWEIALQGQPALWREIMLTVSN
jgi:hypothetical protein